MTLFSITSNLRNRLKTVLYSFSFLASTIVHSTDSLSNSGFNASIYGGYNHLYTTEKLLQLPTEIDTLKQNGGNNEFTGGLGMAYRFDTKALNSFIQAITLGPDLFLFKTTITGNVWQYQNPSFPNYNYSLQIKSVRLMMDGWLDLPPLLFGINPFAGGGIGIANVKTQYRDRISTSGLLAGLTGGEINLNTKTNRNFVYALGAGLKRELFPQMQLSGSYLFTDYGTQQTSTQSTQVSLVQPTQFQMHSHSILVALTYLFG